MKQLKIFLFILLGQAGLAQAQKANEIPCKINQLCTEFIGTPYEKHLKLLKDNYCEYYGNPLSELDNSYPTQAKHYAIKFDGLGCVYPRFLNELSTNMLMGEYFDDPTFDHLDFTKLTFFHLFQRMNQPGHYGNLKQTFKQLFDKKGYSEQFKTLINTNNYDTFCRYWNNAFIPEVVQELKDSMNGMQTYMFIHGYNVPYSLAKIQSIEIAKRIDLFNQNKPFLLLEIYWPSGSRKYSNFSPDSQCCNYSNFENLGTMRLFKYISNRAYLAAFSLRRIFNELNDSQTIKVITHSHGATVITAMAMDPTTKSKGLKARKPTRESQFILLNMREAKPKQTFKVYMNAPAIPGKSTFAAWDLDKQQNFTFWVGVNKNDITLKKNKLPILGTKLKDCRKQAYYRKYVSLQFSRRFSSTTLGCDYHNEFKKTRRVLRKSNFFTDSKFVKIKVGTQSEHDFFCYIKQPGFLDYLDKWVNNNVLISQ